MPVKKKNLVVGAGLSGAVMAQRLADILNEDVLIIDKMQNLAGKACDYDEDDIYVSKFGAHIFHTDEDYIWQYLNSFSNFIPTNHTQYALVDGIKTTVPFSLKSIRDIFPNSLYEKIERKLIKKYGFGAVIPLLDFKTKLIADCDLDLLSNFIFEKYFAPIKSKSLGVNKNEICAKEASKLYIHVDNQRGRFKTKFQGVPEFGYSKLVENILNHKNIKILLGVDFKSIDTTGFDRIFYTGSIDEFFNYKFGLLGYGSAKFETRKLYGQYYQGSAVVEYPDNFDFIRIYEFKHLRKFIKKDSLGYDRTIISKEFPQKFIPNKNKRLYPVLDEKNMKMYKKYKEEAKKLENVYFLGSLGEYKNYSMDRAVVSALRLFENVRFEHCKNDKMFKNIPFYAQK